MAYIEDANLIEEIKSLKISVGGKDVFPDEAKESVLRVISEQPTADVVEVKWIDVKERIPDDNKSVLCYCINTSTEGRTKTIGSYANNIWFLGNGVSERSYPRHYWKVTHWMPLPESPAVNYGSSKSERK